MSKKNLLEQVIGNMYVCPMAKNKDHPGKTMLAGEKVNQCNWCGYRRKVEKLMTSSNGKVKNESNI